MVSVWHADTEADVNQKLSGTRGLPAQEAMGEMRRSGP